MNTWWESGWLCIFSATCDKLVQLLIPSLDFRQWMMDWFSHCFALMWPDLIATQLNNLNSRRCWELFGLSLRFFFELTSWRRFLVAPSHFVFWALYIPDPRWPKWAKFGVSQWILTAFDGIWVCKASEWWHRPFAQAHCLALAKQVWENPSSLIMSFQVHACAAVDV